VSEPAARRGPLEQALGRMVDGCGRRPWLVLAATLAVAVVAWSLAFRVLLHPRTDLRELLPVDSAGLKAFEHQLGRIGGGATLLVVVEAPDRSGGERFIDALADRIEARTDPDVDRFVDFVERGTRDLHAFFHRNRWLYAGLSDIEKAGDVLDEQIAVRSGLVADLSGAGPSPPAHASRAEALGLARSEEAWRARIADLDPFPRGYFETADGRMAGLRIVSKTSGTGDDGGDRLLAAVQRAASETRASLRAGDLRIGYAGDIANAVAEKDSVVGEAAGAGALAFVVVVGAIAWFFRSAWALVVIAAPAVVGVGVAYAFAYLRFGYVNTTGMFLGAIILGNGINYPIVLLSRYRELVDRGRPPADARREAVQRSMRVELVGACVGAIAYGSLTLTRFRGFTQFGWIGFVGMLAVWVTMVPCVPALLSLREARATGGPGPSGRVPSLLAGMGRAASRAPAAVVVVAAIAAVAAGVRVRDFLADPWEYNFDHLGSRESKRGGAGEWSNKAEAVFGGKMNVAGARMVADSPGQVAEVKESILASDAADPDGRLVAGVTTIDDFLPGSPAAQARKLEALARIRGRLTPAVLGSLDDDERARVADMTPPGDLVAVTGADLPALIRRRFEESDGTLGTVFYVRYGDGVSLSDGRNLLRIARSTDDVRLRDGTVVQTASRATVFAEMIRSMRHDGPRAMVASFVGVALVVLVATRDVRAGATVLCALAMAVTWLVGGAAAWGEKLNYVNFVVLPITFAIGCEYPYNVHDASVRLGGDVTAALRRAGGAVALCSFTTMVGYGSLLLADFQALQSFGRLAVVGEVACLIGALLVVPALLRLGSRRAAH
jgi:predicted RND superfamily exporter protein